MIDGQDGAIAAKRLANIEAGRTKVGLRRRVRSDAQGVSAGERYVVQYDPRAVRELTKPDRQVARRIAAAIERLGADPRPAGSRMLAGYPNLRRIRIGRYRVI